MAEGPSPKKKDPPKGPSCLADVHAAPVKTALGKAEGRRKIRDWIKPIPFELAVHDGLHIWKESASMGNECSIAFGRPIRYPDLPPR